MWKFSTWGQRSEAQSYRQYKPSCCSSPLCCSKSIFRTLAKCHLVELSDPKLMGNKTVGQKICLKGAADNPICLLWQRRKAKPDRPYTQRCKTFFPGQKKSNKYMIIKCIRTFLINYFSPHVVQVRGSQLCLLKKFQSCKLWQETRYFLFLEGKKKKKKSENEAVKSVQKRNSVVATPTSVSIREACASRNWLCYCNLKYIHQTKNAK